MKSCLSASDIRKGRSVKGKEEGKRKEGGMGREGGKRGHKTSTWCGI